MVNLFGNTVISGFWGWDKAVVDEWDHKYSEYHNCKNECRNSKCYKTTHGGIPLNDYSASRGKLAHLGPNM